MALYRKKPIVVEAVQYIDSVSDPKDLFMWSEGKVTLNPLSERSLIVATNRGPINLEDTDWIIKADDDDYYPVKDEIFKDIYEPEPATGALQ